MAKKKARRSARPWGTFSFLGIPPGDEIEFRYKKDEGIFLYDPGEKFIVAEQDFDQDWVWIRGREVTWVNEKGLETNYSLSELTDKLWKKRNQKPKTMPWTHKLWDHCDTGKRLSEIYEEKKKAILRTITTQ